MHHSRRQLHRRLVEAQLLDNDGYLRHDPRRSGWRQAVTDDAALAQKLPGLAPGVADTLKGDESPLAEVRIICNVRDVRDVLQTA